MNQPTHIATVRPAEQLLIDLIPELPAGRMVTNTAGRAQFATAYAQRHPAASVTCWFLDLYQCEQAQAAVGSEVPNLQCLCTSDWPEEELDLAALVSGNWSEEAKRHMAAAYHRELRKAGRPWASLQDLLRGLYLCRLQLAVQWLGWSNDWTPPQEHRQDWLLEAIFAARQLGFAV